MLIKVLNFKGFLYKGVIHLNLLWVNSLSISSSRSSGNRSIQAQVSEFKVKTSLKGMVLLLLSYGRLWRIFWNLLQSLVDTWLLLLKVLLLLMIEAATEPALVCSRTTLRDIRGEREHGISHASNRIGSWWPGLGVLKMIIKSIRVLQIICV